MNEIATILIRNINSKDLVLQHLQDYLHFAFQQEQHQ
jgi:hypothetical protein